jgi:hypothetical protein
VDINTEANAVVRRETGVRLGQGGLHFHRLHSASELRKDTITRRVRYTAPMLPNDPIEDRAALGGKRAASSAPMSRL